MPEKDHERNRQTDMGRLPKVGSAAHRDGLSSAGQLRNLLLLQPQSVLFRFLTSAKIAEISYF